MSWIKLDDQWMDHPKIVRAGRDARDVWLASITWCAKHLTDGYFPRELLPSLAVSAGVDVANCQTFARTLLDVCLWEMHDEQYYIHDFLDYNPTKEQAIATREARSVAGRAGGIAKASKMPSKTLANSWQKSAPSPSPSHKKDDNDDGGENPDVFVVWEQNMGQPITPAIADELILAEKDYTPEWVREAIIEAVKNNGRTLRYVTRILENWRKYGFKVDGRVKPSSNGNGASAKADKRSEAEAVLAKMMAEAEAEEQRVAKEMAKYGN